MAEICYEVLSDNEQSTKNSTELNSSSSKRKIEIQDLKMVAGSTFDDKVEIGGEKRQKLKSIGTTSSASDDEEEESKSKAVEIPDQIPRFGFSSICGRRTEMEDTVTICTSFCRRFQDLSPNLHYFGVFDGHGCSHVAMMCRERMHELVKEELERIDESSEWERVMERSFYRMDQEVCDWDTSIEPAKCRCELRMPEYETVGSTAVVAIVTPGNIIVANCGDSRAVLCRDGVPISLSCDHKPDRPDELERIEKLGGRVIYWDGPRVLGVLAMSRAIGDKYLKPYVSCVPEVMIIDRTAEDECLILATDGLWDVVPNETACGVARICLEMNSFEHLSRSSSPPPFEINDDVLGSENSSDMACSEASTLLTKIALARESSDNISVLVVDLSRNEEA